MRRSARLAENQDAKLGNKTESEPKPKKSRSDDRISNIATMDNGTMVESFKFLNYFQLAKNSLASKRFRDVIRRHRHRLALLYVDSIHMANYGINRYITSAIRIFNKDLSHKEYNEWILRNQYSKQIPQECQVAEMENTEDEREFYELRVSLKLERGIYGVNPFYARAELNHKNWPLFQHFIRLLTDPFIYVRSMGLAARNDILHLLEKADCNRQQCNYLCCYLEGNAPKFISWIKDHVRCDQLHILGYSDSNKLNYNREITLFDLFMTGANCSSEVYVSWCDSFPKIVGDFVQKFKDLKECDEYQIVKSVGISVDNGSIDELKKKYAEFIVKEELSSRGTNYTLEIVNNNIGKKLQLTTYIVLEDMLKDPGYNLSCCVSNL